MSGSGNDTLVLVPCLPPETPSRPSASQTVVLTIRVVIVTWCKSECSRCWLAGWPKQYCTVYYGDPQATVWLVKNLWWGRWTMDSAVPASQPGGKPWRRVRPQLATIKIWFGESSLKLGQSRRTRAYGRNLPLSGSRTPALACAASGG